MIIPTQMDNKTIEKICKQQARLDRVNLIRRKLIAAMDRNCDLVNTCQMKLNRIILIRQDLSDAKDNDPKKLERCQRWENDACDLIKITISQIARLHCAYTIMTYQANNQTFNNSLMKKYAKDIKTLVQDQIPHADTNLTPETYKLILDSPYAKQVHSAHVNYMQDFFSKSSPIEETFFHAKLAKLLELEINPEFFASIHAQAAPPACKEEQRLFPKTENKLGSISYLAIFAVHQSLDKKTQTRQATQQTAITQPKTRTHSS